MRSQIQFRRGLKSEWTSKNPILAAGEPGYESDTGKQKVGDGVSRWNDLSYVSGGDSGTTQSASAFVFQDANGVSFGTNGSTVTASVRTDYQSSGPYLTTAQPPGAYLTTAQPPGAYLTTAQQPGAYLTTAMQSDASTAFARTGFTTGTTAGSVLAGTLGTNGLSLAVPSWLTTAAVGGGGGAALQGSGTFTQNTGTIQFANSNGVTFGLSANQMTASVATNYQSQGAYLTTAALSGDTTKYAGVNGSTQTTTGTNIAFTLNTSGATIAYPAYLTTAALSADSSKYAGTSTGMTGGSVTLNTSGIAINLPGYLTTAAATDITSARAGTNTSVATTTGTDLTLGVNTSGVTVGYPKWITTYVNDLTSQRAGTNTSVATTSGTDVTLAVNTSGVTIGYPKYITTYVNDLTSQRAGTNTSVATTTGTDLTLGVNTSGVTIGYPKWITTYVNDLTSQRAGTNTSVATTTGTDITLGVNTSGVTIGYPKWLTTAAATDVTSARAGVNTSVATTTGTDITLGVNTSGVTIGYPAYLTTAALSANTSNYAGINAAITNGSITVNTSGISINLPATATVSGALATLSYWQNGVQIDDASTTLSASASVLQVVPFVLPCAVSGGFIRIPISMSQVSTTASGTTANTTISFNRSYSDAVVILSQGVGASSLSLQYVTSSLASWVFQTQVQFGTAGSQYTVTFNVTYPSLGLNNNVYTTSYGVSSGTVNISSLSMTLFTGPRFLDIPFGASLSAGNYWLAIGRSSNSASNAGNAAIAGASNAMSLVGASQSNLSWAYPGAAVNSSVQLEPGLGSLSTNAAWMSTSSIALANISSVSSHPKMAFQIMRRA